MTSRLNTQGRPFELHYFVRNRSRAAFLKELQSSPFAQQVIIHADDLLGKSDSVATHLHRRYGRFSVSVRGECAQFK